MASSEELLICRSRIFRSWRAPAAAASRSLLRVVALLLLLLLSPDRVVEVGLCIRSIRVAS